MKTIGLVPELYVSDLQKTLSFYLDILGFEILFERPEEKFAYLQRENAQMMLEQIGATRNWMTAQPSYPLGVGISFQIQTEAVDELCATVKKNNIPLFLDIEEKWYCQDDIEVGNRQFLIQDPDGYLLRFYQDLGSKREQK